MRVIEINEKEIKIKEGEDGKYDGATVWDAALVLCYFLQKEARKNQFLCDKQVIELGSGTGIVGIVSSVLGAYTTITDLEEGLGLIEENIKLNFGEESSKCRAIAYKWGEEYNEELQPKKEFEKKYYDIVLAADIIYIPSVFNDLIQTLNDIMNENSIFYFAHELRKKEELLFYSLLSQSFDISQIKEEDLDEVFRCPEIRVFKVVKKKMN